MSRSFLKRYARFEEEVSELALPFSVGKKRLRKTAKGSGPPGDDGSDDDGDESDEDGSPRAPLDMDVDRKTFKPPADLHADFEDGAISSPFPFPGGPWF